MVVIITQPIVVSYIIIISYKITLSWESHFVWELLLSPYGGAKQEKQPIVVVIIMNAIH